MKLSFQKEENGEIKVLIKDGAEYHDFSYSYMIRKLFEDKKIEEPEIKGDFSEDEIASIKDIANEIGESLVKAEEELQEADNSEVD